MSFAGLLKSLFFSSVLVITACGSIRVQEEKDSGPARPVDVSHIPDPVPRHELRTIAGNMTPYKVLGGTYHVMQHPEGYKERGIASWYGKKFHGRRTSNGEIYDMYGMTAAHTTLPIPSYVKVTNLRNQKSVIVRVNDRGPFHGNRIIDLSYTAAKKLGYHTHGTAEVFVEYIDPSVSKPQQINIDHKSAADGEERAPMPTNTAGYQLPDNTFLQVGAFGEEDAAQGLIDKLQQLTSLNVLMVHPKKRKSSLYKVRVGPFIDNLQLLLFRQKLMDANFPAPHVVYP